MIGDREEFEFDLNGFCLIRGFLAPERVAALNAAIDRGASAADSPKFEFVTSHRDFFDLIFESRVLEVCRRWINPFFRFDHAWGVQYPPAAGEQRENLHAGPQQNQGFFQYQWHQGRPAASCLVFAYALKDQPAGQGGLVLVPGSHKSNLLTKNTWADIYDRSLENVSTLHEPALKAGDLIIMAEAVMHGTRRWRSLESGRRNLYYKYCYGFMSWLPQDAAQIQELRKMATSEDQLRVLEAPYVSKSASNRQEWRAPTLADSGNGVFIKLKKIISGE